MLGCNIITQKLRQTFIFIIFSNKLILWLTCKISNHRSTTYIECFIRFILIRVVVYVQSHIDKSFNANLGISIILRINYYVERCEHLSKPFTDHRCFSYNAERIRHPKSVKSLSLFVFPINSFQIISRTMFKKHRFFL